MKKHLILLVMLSLLSLSQVVTAKDIYISVNGNDTKSGLSSSEAVKTLTRVDEIVEMFDVVHVDGLIKITDEPDFSINTLSEDGSLFVYNRGYHFTGKWLYVVLRGGDNNTDGFSGEGVSPLFHIQGPELNFENILIANAVTGKNSSSSAVCLVDTKARFENCVFKNNKVARNAEGTGIKDGVGICGAIYMLNGNDVIFRKCQFLDNDGKQGGAMNLSAGTVLIDGCYFGQNDCSTLDGSNGGAIFTYMHGGANRTLNITIVNSLFEENKAKNGGGAIAMCDEVCYNPSCETVLNIDKSVFVGNEVTTGHGGALFVNNMADSQNRSKDLVTITNSLFANNHTSTVGGGYGGGICLWNVQPESEFNMINSTVYGNYTSGNSGHGGGLVVMEGYDGRKSYNMEKRIYNSIFDGNYALEGAYSCADLSLLTPIAVDEFSVKNCYLGWANDAGGKAGVSLEDNNINYQIQATYDNGLTAGLLDAANNISQFYAIPLSENAASRSYGDPIYLTQFSITEDLSGMERILKDGRCAIGASETIQEDLSEGFDLHQYKPFNLYSNGNWTTICLPYDVTEIVDANGDPIQAYKLKKFESTIVDNGSVILNFVNETSIKAGVPYLISMPKIEGVESARYYMLIDPTSKVSAPAVISENGYSFHGTFNQTATVAPDQYVLNSSTSEFRQGSATSVVKANSGYVSMAVSNPAIQNISISIDGIITGIEEISIKNLSIYTLGAGSLEIISDISQQINIWSVDGRLIRSTQLNQGENYVYNLPSGVCLVDNQKVVIK